MKFAFIEQILLYFNLLKCFLNLKGFNINILSFSDVNYAKTFNVCSPFEGIFL
jgi:hypothetical protein